MGCDHNGYDDYFEKCGDCGMTNEQIHAAECVYDPSGVNADDDGRCDKCGTLINKEQ
jgi:hypothetical protein